MQLHLALILASVYVTTDKALAMPIDTDAYWSALRLITATNVPSAPSVPSDTAAACEVAAYPVCDELAAALSSSNVDGLTPPTTLTASASLP